LSLLLSICICQPAHCSSVLPAAHVLAFGSYGDGSGWATLDCAHDQAGCPGPYIDLPPNAPANKTVLAAAALSLASGASVFVQVDGCSGLAGTFTGGRNGSAFGVDMQ
jgi:hypothetical protein